MDAHRAGAHTGSRACLRSNEASKSVTGGRGISRGRIRAQQPVVPPQPSPPAVEEIPVIESTMPDVAAITVASYFSPKQFAALRRLSELIAPAMNGAPGALEVETPEFLDFLLGESPADRQALYRTGLDELKS